MESYLQSQPGRIMMAAHAVFLATVAIYLLTDSYYAWGIGMPAGITLAFVSVGFSLQQEYLKEALIGITLLPVALWCFAYLTGELDWRATSWPAYGCLFFAAWALFRAAVPPSEKAA
jgi:hypothetical protein